MRVGLIGNGGREHALAIGLASNPDIQLVVAAEGHNQGIADLSAEYRNTGIKNLEKVVDYFRHYDVAFVVIGPEATLMHGVVDLLRKAGLPAVGPTQKQARLEGDKSFMRNLLRDQVGWGSPAWETVTSLDEARKFLNDVGQIVVKPLGLTGGKGVRVMGIQLDSQDDTLAYIQQLIESDGSVLLEECVNGEEFSRMAFVSDGVLLPVPLMQDFKYAYDGDQGMMTGGMGAYSASDGSLPFVTQKDIQQADRLLKDVVQALENLTAESYRGFLYGQFMVTRDGIRLIEFNVRLGDPEALNLMAVLSSDPASLFHDIAKGTLENNSVQFFEQASVSKYLVPDVYPEKLLNPLRFSFDERAAIDAGLSVIHGSVEKTGQNEWLALGSRTLGLVGLGADPASISDKIEAFLMRNPITGLRHRRDVGDDEIIAKKIQNMKVIRDGH